MEYFLLLKFYPSKSVFMNQDLSKLSLNELYDKLSESTALYSKSRKNGFSEMEFAELRAFIEALQKEIEKQKKAKPGDDDSRFLFPPQQSASA